MNQEIGPSSSKKLFTYSKTNVTFLGCVTNLKTKIWGFGDFIFRHDWQFIGGFDLPKLPIPSTRQYLRNPNWEVYSGGKQNLWFRLKSQHEGSHLKKWPVVGIMRFPSQICTRWIDRPEVDWRLASLKLGFWGGKTSSFNISHLNDTPILHNIIWTRSLVGETSGRRWSSPREAFDSDWTPLQLWQYTKKPPRNSSRKQGLTQGLLVNSLQNCGLVLGPRKKAYPTEKSSNQPTSHSLNHDTQHDNQRNQRLLATGSDDGLGRLRKSSESLGEIRWWDDKRMRWLEDEMMRWDDDEMLWWDRLRRTERSDIWRDFRNASSSKLLAVFLLIQDDFRIGKLFLLRKTGDWYFFLEMAASNVEEKLNDLGSTCQVGGDANGRKKGQFSGAPEAYLNLWHKNLEDASSNWMQGLWDFWNKKISSGNIHPWRWTWNLNIVPLKRTLIFNTIIFGFHVGFQGCMMQRCTNCWTFRPWLSP